MNIGGKFSHREISFEALLNPSDPEESDADVILWMGPNKEPIYAHSIILKNASDFYKAALSLRWNKTKEESPTAVKEEDNQVGPDCSNDAVVSSKEKSSSTGSTACATPTDPKSSNAQLSKMYEIHHPEYDKKHMIQVLHYIYRVPTTLETKDVLEVAVIANHLLIRGLEDVCLIYLAESPNDIKNYAFRLYLLAATLFFESDESYSLMSLSLELIYRYFDQTIYSISDLGYLSKREIESLIVGLPLTARQKWILLIAWGLASTGMMDETCDNPLIYIFKESAWRDKVTDVFKEAIKELVHLIPFVELSKTDYAEYVEPFKELGVLDVNLKDFLICSFEANDPKVQDTQLLARIKLLEPLHGFLTTFFPLPVKIKKLMFENAVMTLSDGAFMTTDYLETYYMIFDNGRDCRKKTDLQMGLYDKEIHVFNTTWGEQAAVIVDKHQKDDQMAYTLENHTHIATQPHLEEKCRGCHHGKPCGSVGSGTFMDGETCGCYQCPTYIQAESQCLVRFPPALRNQPIRDYMIFYL